MQALGSWQVTTIKGPGGFCLVLEPQQDSIQAPHSHWGPSLVTASLCLALLLRPICRAHAFSGFLSAVHSGSQELGFQSALHESWKLLRIQEGKVQSTPVSSPV